MIAIEFLQDHDVEYARGVLAASANALVQCKDGSSFHVDELKRLVESVDIIRDLDGIKGAKGTLYNLVQLGWNEFEHRYIDNWTCTRERLEQAIAEFESIYGAGQ